MNIITDRKSKKLKKKSFWKKNAGMGDTLALKCTVFNFRHMQSFLHKKNL